MKIAVVSGGFDPLHSGHLRLFNEASEMGDHLVVCLNSDAWLSRKKGSPFMSFDERRKVLLALKVVDEVVEFDDSDDSCREGLAYLKEVYDYPHTIIFCNGGDRVGDNIPEKDVQGINFVYGVGGYTKENSSSKLLQIVKRRWGNYRVLFQDDKCKVKELIIEPTKGISYQRHFKRSEIWFISKGMCSVKHAKTDKYKYELSKLEEDDVFTVRKGEWHQITNTSFDKPLHIIEIQYGEELTEFDIERDDE
jgi:D-beta-D-heptose 7-phosphate kinase/D-beta-D-heptose 1-phosphate adenosyltransferase|tara:strand:+ start:601 stop:1350 length:750 start_codon:yes stop_codon:yes gene_type:complete